MADFGPTITAGIVAETAAADVVLLAMPWVALEDVLTGLPDWNNSIVIDATNPVFFLDPHSPDANDLSNPLAAYDIKAIDLGRRDSSAIAAEMIYGARAVKTRPLDKNNAFALFNIHDLCPHPH